MMVSNGKIIIWGISVRKSPMNIMFCGQSRPSCELSHPIGRHWKGGHLTASCTHYVRLQVVTIVAPFG